MILDAGSTRARARFHYGFVAFAIAAGLGLASMSEPARAGLPSGSEASPAGGTGLPPLAQTQAGHDVIVVAEKDHHKGDKNWDKGKGNWNKDWGKNDDWKKYNKNWSKNDDWKKNNKNWSKNYNNKNWNKNWPKHWGNYNNNWNGNWNNRAYVRGWNPRPYYGQFVGGVVLGSLLAASGVGIVPYAPQPNLCWYWADPYMYRGYWDYCY
jgi:hypothetical protein